jgi:hypothetical protein
MGEFIIVKAKHGIDPANQTIATIHDPDGYEDVDIHLCWTGEPLKYDPYLIAGRLKRLLEEGKA